jgi:hypothetical protein
VEEKPDPCPERLYLGAGVTARLCGLGAGEGWSDEEKHALRAELSLVLRAFAVFTARQGLVLPQTTPPPLVVWLGTGADEGSQAHSASPAFLNRAPSGVASIHPDDLLPLVVGWMAPQMGLIDPRHQEKILAAFESHFGAIESDLKNTQL